MPRPRRVNGEGQIVHLTARTVDRIYRFEKEREWGEAYIALLMQLLVKHHLTAYAFCLMGNHIHLVVRQDTAEHTVSDFMQVLQGTFARRYNKKHGRHGHFWEERFHQVVITSREALLRIVTYIHLNPVRPGMNDRAEDHAWSSARVWLGMDSPHAEWITLPPEYAELSRDPARRAGIYAEFLRAKWLRDLQTRRPVWTKGLVIGSRERVEAYVAACRGMLRLGRRWSPMPIAGTELFAVRAA